MICALCKHHPAMRLLIAAKAKVDYGMNPDVQASVLVTCTVGRKNWLGQIIASLNEVTLNADCCWEYTNIGLTSGFGNI